MSAAKPTWEGVFATFAEANAETNVFEGSVWLDKIAERALDARARASGPGIPPVAVSTEYALPFVVSTLLRADRPVHILDFGGGMGTSYIPLRAMLPRDRSVRFVVVENAAVTARGREVFAGDDEIEFRTELPSAGERFDVIHFGSSLHYVDDWRGLLASITTLEPDYLVFVDLPAGSNRSFVTAQSFHDRRIPVRFWNVGEFVEAVCALGYELRLQSRYRGYYLTRDAELPTQNFDDDHRLTHTTQLIFRRRRSCTEG